MKLIRALIRPELEDSVLKLLEQEGFFATTKVDVQGRGRQAGIAVGGVSYDRLAKVMLLLAVSDGDLPRVVAAIEQGASTGHPGDGRIFIQDVSSVYTVRTGEVIH